MHNNCIHVMRKYDDYTAGHDLVVWVKEALMCKMLTPITVWQPIEQTTL